MAVAETETAAAVANAIPLLHFENCYYLLGDKMNLTVRLRKQFPESFVLLALAVGSRAAGQAHQWNSHKTVYLTSMAGSFCHLVHVIYLACSQHLELVP